MWGRVQTGQDIRDCIPNDDMDWINTFWPTFTFFTAIQLQRRKYKHKPHITIMNLYAHSNVQYTNNLITSRECWWNSCPGVGASLSIHQGLSGSIAHLWKHSTSQQTSPLIGWDGAAMDFAGSKLTPIIVGQLGYFSIICLWSGASLGSRSCIL